MPDPLDREPFEPDPDAALDAPTYTESLWSGLPNFTCLLCGYSTLAHDRLVLHLSGWHQLPPLLAPPEPAPLPVADVHDDTSEEVSLPEEGA